MNFLCDGQIGQVVLFILFDDCTVITYGDLSTSKCDVPLISVNIRHSGWVISVRLNDIWLLLVSYYNSACVGLWKRMQVSIPVLYICYIVLLVIVLCLLLSNDIELNPCPTCKAFNILSCKHQITVTI